MSGTEDKKDANYIKYSIGSWNENGRGNHRVLLHVDEASDAVLAHIIWRRRDSNPEQKDTLVFDSSTGKQITNVIRVRITREYGDIIFQPKTVPGDYEVYYLPYETPRGNWGDFVGYFAPKDMAEKSWIERNSLDIVLNSHERLNLLPRCEIKEIQARNEFNRFDPMEVIATTQEVDTLLSKFRTNSYLLFPEDRCYPVKMVYDLPYRWIEKGPFEAFTGKAQPGEFYVFQIGVFAARQSIEDISLEFSNLHSLNNHTISSSAFSCFNLAGVDVYGRRFSKKFSVAKGLIRPLWIGVVVPVDAQGEYHGTVVVKPKGLEVSNIRIKLVVTGSILNDFGDSDPSRLSRLRWLDSTIGLNDDPVPPYIPLKIDGESVSLLNRRIIFSRDGFPSGILSNGREILAEPLKLIVKSQDGEMNWLSEGNSRILDSKPGMLLQEASMKSANLDAKVISKTEFDGCITFHVHLIANSDMDVEDIGLRLSISNDVARYMMGMSHVGGYRPSKWKWKWNPKHIDNMLWLGDVNAGLQINLLHEKEYVWPSLFENYHNVGLPESWHNNGNGGCIIEEDGNCVLVNVFTGKRSLIAGMSLDLRFRLLITPFKPIDNCHWNWRYMLPSDGGNIMHLHHGGVENPYINYPFYTWETIADLVKKLKMRNMELSLYYNYGRYSNHAMEIWACRSLGDEIFLRGEKFDGMPQETVNTISWNTSKYEEGAFSWLREHLISGFFPEWCQPLKNGEYDLSILVRGISRWGNYYLEGLKWLMENTGFQELYLDGIFFDREIIKRLARVMYEINPYYRIKYHGADLFDMCETHISTMNWTMEHLPYVSSLWFGEMYDYNKSPDYWLVEISGIPFGITGEMLNYEDGGNPWRGMIYGMIGRNNKSAPYICKLWDEFGIQTARWIGYWDSECPVRTDNKDILATAYLKNGKILIALASWASETVKVNLSVDWMAVGIDSDKANLVAPYIPNFQDYTKFLLPYSVPVEPGKGWMLILSE